MNSHVYVFIETNVHNGISAKNNQPYTLRKIKIADPSTFENHTLEFAENANFAGFNKGDRVTLVTDLRTSYNRDSSIIVTGMRKADK